MTKKSILYLRTDLGTQDLIGGGSVAHTLGVIKGLLDHGHDVICASSAMHTLLSDIKHADFQFIPLGIPSIVYTLGFKIASIISNLFFYYKAEQLIKKHKIDLIYQRYSMFNVVGVWLHQRYNIPLMLEFNGSEVWVDKNWSTGKLRLTSLLQKIERSNLAHAQKIIVVSQVLKDQLLAVGIEPEKIVVNPNGVDIEQFNPLAHSDDRSGLRTQLNVDDKFVVGFASTFGPWHGIELLAQVIPRVVKLEPRAHFLLMGDGQLKEQLQVRLQSAGAADAVTFTGMLHAQEMPTYLAACDAFICPTQPNRDGTPFFGSPTKLFEYMAMGKPIIASDIGQVAELLQFQPAQSLLALPDDYDGFCKLLLNVVHMQSDETFAMQTALQQKVRAHTWHAHVERILRLVD